MFLKICKKTSVLQPFWIKLQREIKKIVKNIFFQNNSRRLLLGTETHSIKMFLKHTQSKCSWNTLNQNVPETLSIKMFLKHTKSKCSWNTLNQNVSETHSIKMCLKNTKSKCFWNTLNQSVSAKCFCTMFLSIKMFLH